MAKHSGWGYKREARVLFVGGGSGANAAMAAAFAAARGAGWLDGKAAAPAATRLPPAAVRVMSEIGIDLAGIPRLPLNRTLLRWADLVVPLDVQADALCLPLPGGVQKRAYPLAEPAAGPNADDAAYRDLRDRIGGRIEGMIGGMRMLQGSVQAGTARENRLSSPRRKA